MRTLFLFLLFLAGKASFSQNLPSLTTGRNINATFSILAFDSIAQEWGIAVATNNIYVGNSTVYITPGLGAFSVIAETEPSYASNGFEQLRQGKSIREAIEFTMRRDTEVWLRQVSGIDQHGNCFAFTGSSWKYEKGEAGSFAGKGYVVMGNQLGDSVLSNMSAAFEKAEGTLAQRLLKALIEGEAAGGQITGKQSSALVVKGTRNEWFNNIDLRVDDSRDPFADLQKLLAYHYGRIRLNQAIMAIQMGKEQKGKALLMEAERMTKGWNGLLSKVAMAWLLLHQPSEAVAVIRRAIGEDPKWKENLSAFYLLKDQPGLEGLIDEKKFGEKDWISAVALSDQLGRNTATEALCQKALQRFPRSSYLYYQLAKVYHATGKEKESGTALETALKLDPKNAEAKKLLTE